MDRQRDGSPALSTASVYSATHSVCSSPASGHASAKSLSGSTRTQSSQRSLFARTCRICWQPEDKLSPLISPCLCRGSSKWVHSSCLRNWRACQSIETSNFLTCPQCLEEYSTDGWPVKASLVWRIAIRKEVSLGAAVGCTLLMFGVCWKVTGCDAFQYYLESLVERAASASTALNVFSAGPFQARRPSIPVAAAASTAATLAYTAVFPYTILTSPAAHTMNSIAFLALIDFCVLNTNVWLLALWFLSTFLVLHTHEVAAIIALLVLSVFGTRKMVIDLQDGVERGVRDLLIDAVRVVDRVRGSTSTKKAKSTS